MLAYAIDSSSTSQESFEGRKKIHVRSLCVGRDIDTRSLRKARNLSTSPLTLEAGRCGCAIIFRYGAVVLFHVEPMEESSFLEGMRSIIHRPAPDPMVEEIELSLSQDGREGMEGNILFVPDFSLPTLQVVAEVLARSVVLERYECTVGNTFETLQPMAASLGRGRITRVNYRTLLNRQGDVLLDQQEMVGRIAITDKPDVLWDHPQLERLYARLDDDFEIPDRFEAVEAKLNMIGRTIQTSIDLVQNHRSMRVEWYIVVLIVVEIVLTLYEMFFRAR
jgi:required for meiotic nuclear division protein 1